jgi:hypothetical protein
MNRWMKTLLMVALVVGAVAMSGRAALADATDQEVANRYAETMWYFVPVLGRHASDVDRTVGAVAVKPELAEWLAELAKRGETMVYDLDGSPPPVELEVAHERLLSALRQLNEAAQIGADDAQGATHLVATYRPMLDEARRDIRAWLMARGDTVSAEPGAVVEVGQ